MKKIQKVLALSLASLMLSACNEPISSSSSAASSSSYESSVGSSSSSQQDVGEQWDESLQKLMKKYCGEVLPYPEGKLFGTIKFTERSQNGTTFLEIYDEAKSFTLKTYSEMLEDSGWNVTKDYEGNAIRKDANGTEFVESVKKSSDGKTGYDVSYFFDSNSPSANVIWCFNNLSGSLTENTAWSEEEESYIQYGLLSDLPFIKLGSDYKVVNSSENVLSIFDYCAIDLRKDYSDLLAKNGFILNEKISKENGLYYLTKVIDNGSTIMAALSYSNGNLFKFAYLPKYTESSSWPKDAVKEIEKENDVTVPSLTSTQYITGYSYYVKNGIVHITVNSTYTKLFDKYEEKLIEAAFQEVQDTYGSYTNWEEKVEIVLTSLFDEYGSSSGLDILICPINPSSTFSKSWPKEAISSFLNTFKINVTCPDFVSIPDTGKDLKYTVVDDFDAHVQDWYDYILANGSWMGIDVTDKEKVKKIAEKTAEEEMAVFIETYDPDKKILDAYDEVLYKAGWYDSSSDGIWSYEDPTGELAIYFSNYNNVTHINVGIGDHKEHTPIFGFKNESMILGVGTKTFSDFDMNMLPYEVTFTSSDTTGKISIDQDGYITIADDAEIGMEATISATINVTGESAPRVSTCKITVAERSPYTTVTAIDAVAKLLDVCFPLEDDSHKANHDEYGDWTELNASSVEGGTLDALKKLVTEKLIPETFVAEGDWQKGEPIINPDNLSIKGAYVKKYVCDGIVLNYTVYEDDDALILQIAATKAA